VNGLGCRQTEAEWSFDYLRKHSSPTTISGGTRSTTARAADGEVLVAAKLHSGRKRISLTSSLRFPSIDLGMVETHLHRGDTEALRQQLSEAQAFIEEGGLDHRFKEHVRSIIGLGRGHRDAPQVPQAATEVNCTHCDSNSDGICGWPSRI